MDAASATSSDDEAGFTPVLSRKGKRRQNKRSDASDSSSESDAEAPPKTAKTGPAPSPVPTTSAAAPAQPPTVPAGTRVRSPPAVHVPTFPDLDWEQVVIAINHREIEIKSRIFHAKRQAFAIFPKSSTDHRALTSLLDEQGIPYYSHTLPEERLRRVVMRGIPIAFSTDAVKRALSALGMPYTDVHRMHKSSGQGEYDMVLVTFPNDLELASRYFKLTSLPEILDSIRVEAPHKKGPIGQCHNCQRFGHSSRHCKLRPRCVKCPGDHSTAECPRPKKGEENSPAPVCVNCGQTGHPASYRGCPKAPKPAQRLRVGAGRVPASIPIPTVANTVLAPAYNAWSRRPVIAKPAPTPKPVAASRRADPRPSAPSNRAAFAPAPAPASAPIPALMELSVPTPMPVPAPATAPASACPVLPIGPPTMADFNELNGYLNQLISPEFLELCNLFRYVKLNPQDVEAQQRLHSLSTAHMVKSLGLITSGA